LIIVIMMRQSIIRCSRQLVRPTRLFSTSVRTMAEGDLGAPAGRGFVAPELLLKAQELTFSVTPFRSVRKLKRMYTSSSKKCRSMFSWWR